MTCSPREITSSSGRTGLKICRTFRLPTGPLPTELVVVMTEATEKRRDEEPILKNESRATERKDEVDPVRVCPPPELFASGLSEDPLPVMNGAKGRGSLPSSV